MSDLLQRRQRWNEAELGPLSYQALKEHLETKGFRVRRCAYPAKVWIPDHSHPNATVDAVLEGSITSLGLELKAGQWLEIAPGEAHHLLVGESDAVTLHGVKTQERESGARLALLIALVVAINVWSWLHLGLRLENLLVTNVLIGAVPAVLQLARKPQQNALRRLAFEWLDRLLSKAGLTLLASLFLILGSCTSSVVIDSALDAPVKVRLGSGDASENTTGRHHWLTPGKPLRFFLWTHPGVRSLTLQVAGFRKEAVSVIPWWPRRLSTLDDLTPAITILVRLDPSLGRRTGETLVKIGDQQLTVETDEGSASFVLGDGDRYIPEGVIDSWASSTDGSAEILSSWLHFTEPEGPISIGPGSNIELEFRNPKGDCQAWAKFRVGRQNFQDRLLRPGTCKG